MDRARELATSSKRDLGQIIEWQVWSAMVGFSDRITHVFLPLDDRGVDGILRRLDDDAMCAIQVKGRTSLHKGELQVVLRDVAIADTNITVVVALLDPTTMTLHETVFVLDVASVNRLGSHTTNNGARIVELAIPYPHKRGSRWERHACRLSGLADRVLSASTAPPLVAPLAAIPPGPKDLVGHLAELEVIRLLGEGVELNTFKSFPDIEVAEYLVRHRPSGRIRGVQVKCITLAGPNGHGMVNFHRAAFRPSPAVDVVVLTYRSDLHGFDEHAWVIPAVDIPTLVSTKGANIELMLHPAGGYGSKFDRYRTVRSRLAEHYTHWFAGRAQQPR
ncbi:MAG: hypothetical protein JF887_00540 [Candidatus Dormibacteraeota bacterium]|uniref:DUF4365 domain-containing protein n=1 Tax=Candidatus Amunia macphersoniae TaxID=3127014 RepID=A0A934KMM1_9BACT|nr:hypothetical protein [Candidatus Dormibacteraeota bacterium]